MRALDFAKARTLSFQKVIFLKVDSVTVTLKCVKFFNLTQKQKIVTKNIIISLISLHVYDGSIDLQKYFSLVTTFIE